MRFSAKPVRKTAIAQSDIVVTADPTVSGSSVYIGAGDHIAFGGQVGLIAVFRLVDGELTWAYQHRSGIEYPMILGEHLVVVAVRGKILVFNRTA